MKIILRIHRCKNPQISTKKVDRNVIKTYKQKYIKTQKHKKT